MNFMQSHYKLVKYNSNHIGTDKAFTLIELIIIMLILSLLAAVSLQSFLNQSRKAREAEFTNSIGLILRSQQAYHWEKGIFADGATDQIILNRINVAPNIKYIDSFNISSTATESLITPTNNDFDIDNTRAYSGGIFSNALNYDLIICRTKSASQQTVPPINDDDCDGNDRVR